MDLSSKYENEIVVKHSFSFESSDFLLIIFLFMIKYIWSEKNEIYEIVKGERKF